MIKLDGVFMKTSHCSVPFKHSSAIPANFVECPCIDLQVAVTSFHVTILIKTLCLRAAFCLEIDNNITVS